MAKRNNVTCFVKTTVDIDCDMDYCPTSRMFKGKQAKGKQAKRHGGQKSSSKDQVSGE